MKNIALYVACAFALTSCGGRSAAEYESLNAEVEELKTKCDSFQQCIHNKNLTDQDLQDRQYEIDNIGNILHADERSISSCITRMKEAESFVRQISADAADDESIRSVYRKINEVNAELKRCAGDIASEGTERPAE